MIAFDSKFSSTCALGDIAHDDLHGRLAVEVDCGRGRLDVERGAIHAQDAQAQRVRRDGAAFEQRGAFGDGVAPIGMDALEGGRANQVTGESAPYRRAAAGLTYRYWPFAWTTIGSGDSSTSSR